MRIRSSSSDTHFPYRECHSFLLQKTENTFFYENDIFFSSPIQYILTYIRPLSRGMPVILQPNQTLVICQRISVCPTGETILKKHPFHAQKACKNRRIVCKIQFLSKIVIYFPARKVCKRKPFISSQKACKNRSFSLINILFPIWKTSTRASILSQKSHNEHKDIPANYYPHSL